MLCVEIKSIMLGVVMRNVVMLSVIMLNVVAPQIAMRLPVSSYISNEKKMSWHYDQIGFI
jgi:hypothetical protein